MPELAAYGVDWCRRAKSPVERSILLVSRRTRSTTARLLRGLSLALPVEDVQRTEEVDRYGWEKTLALVRCVTRTRSLDIPDTIDIDIDGEGTLSFRW